MMLSGGEVAVKLAGSAAKNAAAMLLALARNHKKVYGKTSLKKILQQTRDIRTFSLTPEQYREFGRQAKDKVLFAGIQDKEQPGTRRTGGCVSGAFAYGNLCDSGKCRNHYIPAPGKKETGSSP